MLYCIKWPWVSHFAWLFQTLVNPVTPKRHGNSLYPSHKCGAAKDWTDPADVWNGCYVSASTTLCCKVPGSLPRNNILRSAELSLCNSWASCMRLVVQSQSLRLTCAWRCEWQTTEKFCSSYNLLQFRIACDGPEVSLMLFIWDARAINRRPLNVLCTKFVNLSFCHDRRRRQYICISSTV